MTTVRELRPIRDGLRAHGIPVDYWPPLDAPIPRTHTVLVFGEPDEGRYPYQLEVDESGYTITDNAGDLVLAGHGVDPIALCIEAIETDLPV